MSPDRQRIVITEACGWRPSARKWVINQGWSNQNIRDKGAGWFQWERDRTPEESKWGNETINTPITRDFKEVPDWLRDLNAMHAAKLLLLTTRELCDTFNHYLVMLRPSREADSRAASRWTWGQSAAIECEAMLHTIGKWEGGEE